MKQCPTGCPKEALYYTSITVKCIKLCTVRCAECGRQGHPAVDWEEAREFWNKEEP